jgi:hypothetical protein
MGLFSKRPSTIVFADDAVNVDRVAQTSTGMMGLDEAKRVLRLSVDQDLRDESIWRVRSDNCGALRGDGFWAGVLKVKGAGVAIFVGKKNVGTIEPRGVESAKKMIKAHGGSQATCVISCTGSSSWNVYANML